MDPNRSAAKAYARVGLETGVAAASPHKLIAMLFDGAMIAILRAQNHMQAGQIVEKGQAISKAISIIDSGLHASLNLEAGGEVAKNLDALYGYMTQQLGTGPPEERPGHPAGSPWPAERAEVGLGTRSTPRQRRGPKSVPYRTLPA